VRAHIPVHAHTYTRTCARTRETMKFLAKNIIQKLSKYHAKNYPES